MAELTERQAVAWPEAIAEAQRYVPSSTIHADITSYYWTVAWADETRPGRGHSVDAIWCDGEFFVQIWMDVYGYPSVSVAEMTWLHNSSNEECECGPCIDDRKDTL